MNRPNELVRELRLAAGLSQRALAKATGTSQPQLVRYERGGAVPSWRTLQRIAAACGRQLSLRAEPRPDSEDVELAESLLDLTPQERLGALARFARLRSLVESPR